jgi:hypothetical protein
MRVRIVVSGHAGLTCHVCVESAKVLMAYIARMHCRDAGIAVIGVNVNGLQVRMVDGAGLHRPLVIIHVSWTGHMEHLL